MDLKTSYMGLELNSPIIVSSSDLTGSIDNIVKCEEAGAGAVVLKSLFEEQILANSDVFNTQEPLYQWFSEAIEYAGELSKVHGIDQYLHLIQKAKKKTNLPIIASINCVTPQEWTIFAKQLEAAGADGLELNISIFPFSESVSGAVVEQQYVDIVRNVKQQVEIPVSVKMGPYFSNISQMAHRLDNNGVDALVMFNRFYQPDVDVDHMRLEVGNILSSKEEMTHSLRWIGLLSSKLNCDLAASTGVHDGKSVIKQLLVGAAAAQVCSAIYSKGFKHIQTMLNDVETWMKDRGFNSISEFKGRLVNDEKNTVEWERVQFMKKVSGKVARPSITD